ncbi:MAG: hypothetical protein ACI8ZM_003688 [Crocinitomix sp.]|jgi:hypothetical protein
MKVKFTLVTLILSVCFVVTSCKKNKYPKVLHRTWTSDLVAVSRFGHFGGESVHVYNEDNTYSSESNFTDPSTNCHAVFNYVGTYSGVDGTLNFTPTGGEVEISLCDSTELNQALYVFSAADLEGAQSSLKYEVDGNTLIYSHEDGMHRIYRRQ